MFGPAHEIRNLLKGCAISVSRRYASPLSFRRNYQNMYIIRQFTNCSYKTPSRVLTKPNILSIQALKKLYSTENVNSGASDQPADKGRLLIGFTCKVCNHRQYKTMSKVAYTKGVVLMQCDGCKNRHLIADNLGWFKDSKITIEDIVKENGEEVRKLKDAGLLDSIEAENVKKALEDHLESQQKGNEDGTLKPPSLPTSKTSTEN
ncbi:hypothetical protein H4219_002165 [Mycoemilia scoparia]|uniref:DNL-type domain-containing protein n=1 Tax=Mycoemilia scoparia TaxID=417184 RepID=A0A9W7ZZ02_9FUNG|nr:hypothetical protein H4219_002165 [Mycoemilia scoparia]